MPVLSMFNSLVQAGFKRQLKAEVAAFVVDARDFRADWLEKGPMAPNLTPTEATLHLQKYKQQFEVSTSCQLTSSASTMCSTNQLDISPPGA